MLPALSVLHFSPTGSTRAVALHLAEALADTVTEYDLSAPGFQGASLKGGEFAVCAAPVFGGRIPARAAAALKRCSGRHIPTISLAVYGGRAYEDALLELNDILTEQGFTVMASGAFTARHSMVESIAAGRPDAADLAEIRDFARAILGKAARADISPPAAVPGNRPYKTASASSVTPLTSEACTACGLCAGECPAGAIPADAPQTTRPESCFLCMRCVWICPEKARSLPPQFRNGIREFLLQHCPERSANDVFL